MKKIIFLLLASALLSGCNKDTVPTDIIGEWSLIEVLADPGDGSGRFRPVKSDKQIRFLEDGTYYSAGSICDFTTASEGDFEGTYTELDTGYQISCGESPDFPIGLRIEKGFLIVSFPCIEPCLQKFRKRS